METEEKGGSGGGMVMSMGREMVREGCLDGVTKAGSEGVSVW